MRGDPVGQQKHVEVNFAGCIAAHDNERLADIDQGREYPISGWFVNSARTTPVVLCMQERGWLAVPTSLYAP
jgi:hypothetical protein